MYRYQNCLKTVCYKAIDDLSNFEIKPLMNKIHALNKTCSKNCFGYLPLMIGVSKCQLGAVNSESSSYSERINSATNYKPSCDKNMVSTDPDLFCRQ